MTAKKAKCSDRNNAASGAIPGDVWTDGKVPVVDSLGDEFLEYVRTGIQVTVGEDGEVTVE